MNKIMVAALKGVAIALVLSMTYTSCKTHMSPEWGTNIQASSWMPEGSSNGAYGHGGSFFILGPPVYYREFDISEPHFIQYMEKEGWNYEEIVEPIVAKRYLILFVNDSERNRKMESFYTVQVTQGLYHTNYEVDSGRRIVYDRDRGRAFYRYDTR